MWQLVSTLLLVGFVGAYWRLVALVVAAVLAVKFGPGSGGATRRRSPAVSSRSLFILPSPSVAA